MRARHITVAMVCVVVIVLGGCKKESEGKRVVQRPGEPDYVRTGDDALMERAIAKGRATQQELIKAIQSPKASWHGFSVKKGFPTPGGGEEHMWIVKPTWDGKVFHGVINNEPVDTHAVALGDTVTVTPAELSDWMYLDGNRLIGGYTVRVLFSEKSPQEKQDFVKHTGMEVPAVDF